MRLITMATNSKRNKIFKIYVCARDEEEAMDLVGRHVYMTIEEADENGN